MIKSQPIIGVNDVEKSSEWYQQLLGCKSSHGGSEFEMLADDDGVIFLCLHKWNVHEHPTMSNADKAQPGHGLILYLRVENLDMVWANAQALASQIEERPQINSNSGKEQASLRDPDGYFLMISL